MNEARQRVASARDGDPIGVGLIGANPDHAWAAFSHIPALASLPEYELRAVSTSRAQSAAAAAEAFKVPAYDNHAELVRHPAVGLVVVAVKVTAHRELVRSALEAGKHVYCEWPLGNGLAEASDMAELASRSEGVAIVGLQARAAPVINRIRDLVAEGYVGRVLSTSIIANSPPFGGSIGQTNTYMLDARNGANMLTVPLGHLADALCYCVGEFSALKASFATVRPKVKVTETSETISTSTPDQIAVNGVLESGAVASVHLRGGRSRGTNLLWEINGTEGDLLVAGQSAHISNDETGEPTLYGGRGEDRELALLPIPDPYRWAPLGTPRGLPFNIAQLYRQLAGDIRNATSLSPTFDTAALRHRMLDAIARAAETGGHQSYLESSPVGESSERQHAGVRVA
jgi:predicted dehydrogenase